MNKCQNQHTLEVLITEKILSRSCPLCGATLGRLIEPLRFVVFDDSPIVGHCDLVTCSTCGFVFYDTQSNQKDFDQYYRQNSYYCTASSTGTGGLGVNDRKRFEDLHDRIAPLIVNRQAAIFDVGCAKGGLLRVLARKGYTNLYGVDMLADCVQHTRTESGISADIGSAFELPFPERVADVLIYSHVVEHVIDLQTLIKAAHAKLSDDGFIYVEVPDSSKYGAHSIIPYQDLFLEHVNHFSTTTLVAFFSSGGFQAVATGQFELAVSPSGKVSCTWGIFRKGTVKQLEPDWLLSKNLMDYMSWSRSHPAHKFYAKLMQAQTPLYLWGMSQYAMLLLGQTTLGACNLRGFIDKDLSKQERTLAGCSIQSADILSNAGSECAVIVTALGYEEAIANELFAMNFKGRVFDSSMNQVDLNQLFLG